MKVAVLMSSYNGEKYIREQLDSILAQIGDFQIEIVVRDDDSNDSTQQILEEYSQKGLLSWYTGENLGPAASFLNLIKHCPNYDYYSFADQDDYWMPEKLYSGVLMLEGDEDKIMLYAGNAILVGEKLEDLGRNVYMINPKTNFETLICAGGLLGCTMIFNSKLANLLQSRDIPEVLVLHDFYLAATCVSLGGDIIYDSIPHMKYRQHESNVVGVPNGVYNTIVTRIKRVTTKPKVSIADQADAISRNYSNEIDSKKLEWLSRISNYRKTFISRFLIACSFKVKYINKNMGFVIRVSMLLGNR